jgi:hypothetical protein
LGVASFVGLGGANAFAQVQVLGTTVATGTLADGATLVTKTAENSAQLRMPEVTPVAGGCAGMAGRYVVKSCNVGEVELGVIELLINEKSGSMAMLSRDPKSEFLNGSIYMLVGKTIGGAEFTKDTMDVQSMSSSQVTCGANAIKIASEIVFAAEDKKSGQKGGWQGVVTTGLALNDKTLKMSIEIESGGQSQGAECVLERSK